MTAPLNWPGNKPKTLQLVVMHRHPVQWKPIAENPSRNRSFSPIRVTRDAKVSENKGVAKLYKVILDVSPYFAMIFSRTGS